MDELAGHLRDQLAKRVEVTAENVVSLLDLVVVYAETDELKGNVQAFVGSEWNELADSGLIFSILREERFLHVLVEAVSKRLDE